MSLIARYGKPQRDRDYIMVKVYDQTLEGITSNEMLDVFEPGGTYMLFTTAWAISTNRVYGQQMRLLSAPDTDAFGSYALTNTGVAASTNTGVTLTLNSDSTLTWKCSSSSYRVRLRIYKLGGTETGGSSEGGGISLPAWEGGAF